MNQEKITYGDFEKVEIRAGKILSAERVTDTDKLLKLMVDFGVLDELAAPNGPDAPNGTGTVVPRQIISGIAAYFPDPATLVGRTCMFVTNLLPRTIRGYESNGMLFAVSTPEGAFSLLEPAKDPSGLSIIPPGTRAK